MANKSILTNNKIIDIWNLKKTKSILGICAILVSTFLFFALTCFFWTGKNDQSIIAEHNVRHNEYKIKKSHTPLSDSDKKELKELTIELDKIKDKAKNINGYQGALIAESLINNWLGLGVFALCFWIFLLGLRMATSKKFVTTKWLIFCVFASLWLSLFMAFFVDRFTEDSFIRFGGDIGIRFSNWLIINIGNVGTFLIILASAIICAIITFGTTLPFIKNIYTTLSNKKTPFNFSKKEKIDNNTTDDGDSVKIGDDIIPDDWKNQEDTKEKDSEENTIEVDIKEIEPSDKKQKVAQTNSVDDDIFEEIKPAEDEKNNIIQETTEESNIIKEITPNDQENQAPYDPRKDLSQYQIPRYYDKYNDKALLTEYPVSANKLTEEEKASNRKRIVETLLKFGIGIKKIYETIGPTITLYEIVPEDGVRINKIRSLADDIMLSLAATGIRIIAPIPGKGTIGIEVPNANPQIVSMFSTIASNKFQESKYELPVVLGRTITNEVFMFDLCKMPHLLVAGATGQGKSVGLNAIITSLLFKKHPSELKLVLIDPKKVEFNIYSDIEKHFLAKLEDELEPVITDVEKVKQTLNSLCKEMDARYDLLKAAHARNIKEYNEKFISRRLNPMKGHKYLPYIVVIVDEFGDLIMTAGKEIEMPIARIAQLARAVGIHMIIATQRPSVNIITGIIKANFPARIAFKVSSGVDSKTILDGPGAQQLIGRGDMLFTQGNEPTRVQCAFVDTPEVENIVHFIGNQQGYPSAFILPESDIDDSSADKKEVDMSKKDSLFDEVARYVVSSQQGSVSNIQRNFEIGFNRAGRIVDQLEASGIVGPQKGSKPRDVLIATEYDLDKILNS